MKAYKLFRTKKSNPGKIYPLFVLADKETPFGVWLDAEKGEMTEDGRVKSRLGNICYRPGWHLSDVPCAVHIGKTNENGVISWMHDDHVWCECEFSDEVCYQHEADSRGMRANGTINKVAAMLKIIPENGYYRYKTNPRMLGEWIIAGKIKVNRVLNDEEIADICYENGIVPLLHRFDFDYSVFDSLS